ncbi:MAG: 23S rRNA (adenine(2503)-C(2))-methyltransferase RlmN [Anaerovoracaceae bacterium]|nr:23S rRNA (adenine(2503)-C(2))-methyltransferase RlmN [Anaerovoracaceae bacterium]
MKEDIRGLLPYELEKRLTDMGEPAFRGKQVFQWLFKDVESFRDMRNIPKALIAKLEDNFVISGLTLKKHQKSKYDATEKFLFELNDGNQIEAILMGYKYGNTVCISSQAGCRMGCKFCASGLLGLSRNLTQGEIMGQVTEVSRISGRKINNVVIMGTGEPLDNYQNISKFLRLIHEPNGMNMSMRSITISTCGLVDKLKCLAEEFPQVNVAISLHAPTDEKRSQIMPINKKFPITELIGECRDYVKKTGRRISFEYTLVKDFNDGDDDMLILAVLLRGLNCHVNLIPLNQVDETGLCTSGRKRALECMKILNSKGIQATVRRQLGSDINGACGQLRLKQSVE